MCNDAYNERLAPLNPQHLREVQASYPRQAEFAEHVFGVLTKNLTPQVNLLVTFVILKELYDRGRSGIFNAFGRVLYVPLSIVAKTGSHQWARFRPTAVEELHSSFLSFMMAKSNRLELEVLFGQHGLMLSQRHCCGILLGFRDDVVSFEDSTLAGQRNEMRSYAEAMGMPVVTSTFEAIPTINSDLGPVELEFYRLYEATFSQMELQGRAAYIDSRQDGLWEQIVEAIPVDSCLGSQQQQQNKAA